MQKTFIINYLFIIISLTIGHNAIGQQQMENPGFEYWEEFGFGPDTLEPVNWSSLKSSDGGELINNVIPVVWERSDDAHSGMHSIKLENMPILTLVAPGTLTNGRVHATLPPTDAYVYTIKEDPNYHTPFTNTPDSLIAWAKWLPQENDKAHIFAILHTDTAKIADSSMTNWVAVAHIEIPEEVGEWTKFEVPFVYLNSETPEYILFAIYAGDAQEAKIGSILYLDDIEMRYYNVGTENSLVFQPNIYFDGDILKVRMESIASLSTIEILDISGRSLYFEKFVSTGSDKFDVDLHPGLYICKVKSGGFEYSKKIIRN